MFAKQARIAAVAALAFAAAGSAFAHSNDRNVFDTETYVRMPAAASVESRDAVRAEYIAKRDAKGISSFNPEAAFFAQNNDSKAAIVALLSTKSPKVEQAEASGLSRDAVRAEVIAARAKGEMNVFDTETNLRVAPSVRAEAPVTLAQR